MTERLENLVGAFANSIADAVLTAAKDEVDVAGPSAAALALIQHEPGIAIETLRTGLALTHAGTVRLIDRLEGAGLVERSASQIDKRAVALSLTAEGEAVAAAILARRQSVISHSLKSLSVKEREALERIVEKLLQATVKDVAHAYAICRLCDDEACEDCPIEAGLESSPT
ncbi:MAG: MarR family transcriptional regulator [Pseudomonadota bacterium]